MEIKEIAILVPLQQSPQLCSEDLLRREGHDLGIAPVPVVFHCEGLRPDAERALVLAGVDLDFEF